MMRFGIELEGFATVEGEVVLPFDGCPTDGFPGLVELASRGHDTLEGACSQIYAAAAKLPLGIFNFNLHEHRFSGKEMAALRAKQFFGKEIQDVKNLYGREPRRLGNRTLASCQINISNLISNGYIHYTSEHPIKIADQFGLLDIPTIVRALDEEFAPEIRKSGRQKGVYCIKDNGIRLEYRSLPNFAFDLNPFGSFLYRVRKALRMI